MKRSIVALLLAFSAAAGAAEGGFESAGALLKYMTGSGIEERLRGWYSGYAFGYVVGIADVQDRVKNPATGFCFDLPAGMSKGALFQVVKTHLEAREGSRRESAESVVQEALDRAFPCGR